MLFIIFLSRIMNNFIKIIKDIILDNKNTVLVIVITTYSYSFNEIILIFNKAKTTKL